MCLFGIYLRLFKRLRARARGRTLVRHRKILPKTYSEARLRAVSGQFWSDLGLGTPPFQADRFLRKTTATTGAAHPLVGSYHEKQREVALAPQSGLAKCGASWSRPGRILPK